MPTGRNSIFRDKRGGMRVQGNLTKPGSRKFETRRAWLAKLAKRSVEQVSDADVIEALSRGEDETTRYLKGLHKDA